MKETVRLAFSFTPSSENEPSTPVEVPFVVPSTTTAAPITGLPLLIDDGSRQIAGLSNSPAACERNRKHRYHCCKANFSKVFFIAFFNRLEV